jgi:hypothetical protein
MKGFVYKTVLFLTLLCGTLSLALYFLKNKSAENNILAALNDKHLLLKASGPGKIIFAGGSNLSFGLNSGLLVQQFKRPVVNMGIHGGLGMKFMLDDVKSFIGKGDLVVLCPEYENFYTDNFYGETELVSAIFDVYPEGRSLISGGQWLKLMKHVPGYAAKKISKSLGDMWRVKRDTVADVYHRNSFNRYGDAVVHWNQPGTDFPPLTLPRKCRVNPQVFEFLKKFRKDVESKGGSLLLLAPAIERESFERLEEIMPEIDKSLREAGLSFHSVPRTYVFEKDYFFNTYYHLNKRGVDLRTEKVVNDLKKYLAEQ